MSVCVPSGVEKQREMDGLRQGAESADKGERRTYVRRGKEKKKKEREREQKVEKWFLFTALEFLASKMTESQI